MALHFELVSPEKLLMSQDVEMAIIPGVEGDMGVLQEHMPVISILRPGVVTLMKDGKVEERLFVEGGFVEITQDSCIVLAEHASQVSEINHGDVTRILSEILANYADAKSDQERARIERQIAIAEAKIEALAKSAY